MAGELKDQRVVTMMSSSELQAIDDWMFANRIRSRGEAIRRLCMIALAFDGLSDDALGSLAKALDLLGVVVDALAGQVDDDDQVAENLLPLLMPTVEAHDNLLRAAGGLSTIEHQKEALSEVPALESAIEAAAVARANGLALRAKIESDIRLQEVSED